MKRDEIQPIVIRRVNKRRAKVVGGSWKIAYADFVTAMMAFFLLMWLISSVSHHDLQGIEEYFRTPLKVALTGGTTVGNSASIIQGGGTDLTRTDGQVQRANPGEPNIINLQAAQAELARQEVERLRSLRMKVAQIFERNPRFQAYRNQIKLDITSEGLRIQIVDDQNRPMFDVGRAQVHDWMREILRELGSVLNQVENKISLAGHTDAMPYFLGDRGYSNWELSADRANASRRELVAGGIAENKIIRVVGLASSIPLNKADPYDQVNRRISIVVLNRKTEEMITQDGSTTQVYSARGAAKMIDSITPNEPTDNVSGAVAE